jgi:hypothetical protein
MNRPDGMLTLLEPPPGGWARLRRRRTAASRWTPSWWALASGSAAAAAWLLIASGHTEIQMQLTGARLIGERSQGEQLQTLDNGHSVPLASGDANVRIYLVKFTGSTPAAPAQK